jgi:hypothetical protein
MLMGVLGCQPTRRMSRVVQFLALKLKIEHLASLKIQWLNCCFERIFKLGNVPGGSAQAVTPDRAF